MADRCLPSATKQKVVIFCLPGFVEDHRGRSTSLMAVCCVFSFVCTTHLPHMGLTSFALPTNHPMSSLLRVSWKKMSWKRTSKQWEKTNTKRTKSFNNDLLTMHIMPASIFIMALDHLLFSFMNLFFMHYWIVLIGRFSLVLKWDNLYFHHSQDLLANNIVSSVSCKFIWAFVVQAFNIFHNIPGTFGKLYHMFSIARSLPFSLHLYLFMHWTIK